MSLRSAKKLLDVSFPKNLSPKDLYLCYLKEFRANEKNSAVKRVKVFNLMLDHYLTGLLDLSRFSVLVGTLCFSATESDRIEKVSPEIAWLVYFASDLNFMKTDQPKHFEEMQNHLWVYKNHPEQFKRWWRANIENLKREKFSPLHGNSINR